MAADGLDFLVHRDDWRETRFFESTGVPELSSGQVLFRVDRFAFTSNNISYAKAGDMLRYWDFFPAPAALPAEERWGRIPTMGFADVQASAHPDVQEGERVFGFFPMSRYLVIEPSRATGSQIVDGVAHREGIAPAYNAYARASQDPDYAADHEDEHMLMRGLFMTSFLAEDYIREQGGFGASTYVIASASSKTAIALAYLVSRAGQAKVIGLTSPRNAAFVKGLDCYDEVVHYSDVESIEKAPTIFVDMAGNGAVVNALHHHLGDDLRYNCVIGATHWDASERDKSLPGATPEFFFAPAQIKKRTAEWGPAGLQERMGEAWASFRDSSAAWLTVRHSRGRAAVEQVYHDTLEGRTQPNEGHVLSLWDEA